MDVDSALLKEVYEEGKLPEEKDFEDVARKRMKSKRESTVRKTDFSKKSFKRAASRRLKNKQH